MIGVALIGLGNISPAHIEAYLTFPERAKVVAMVDIIPEKAKKRAREYGIACDIYNDHRDILGREDIQLVDICTPPYVHAQIAINSLRAGKHVICEKPMAASLAECDAINQAARESGKLFSPIAQNRYRGPIAKLKTLLDSGIAGEVKHFRVDSFWWRGHSYYDLWWRGTWEKEGGGCTLNHAVHQVDMLGWMMGLPDELSATLTNVSHDNAQVEDLSVSVLRYGRALATVTASVVHHGDTQALHIQCAHASLGAPYDTYASVSRPNGFPERNPALEEEIRQMYDALPDLPYEGHVGQIDNVLSCLEQGCLSPAITGEDGRRTIEIISAIYKAGSSGERVKLPLAPQDPFYSVAGIQAHVPHFYEKTATLSDLSDDGITMGSDYQSKA